MLRTGLVIDPRYLDHHTGAGHPERPARLEVLLSLFDEAPRPELHRLEPRPATKAEIARVHHPDHVDRVAATANMQPSAFDADTPVSAKSYDAAVLASGGLLTLVEAITTGEVDNGFALVRPPGHHAEVDRAMGFCLFNNVAVAARHLLESDDVDRVLIVDWDVHHGNGTQHVFDDDPCVLFISTHRYPFFPGTGAAVEVGRGDGIGFTVNLPLPGGCGDGEYLELFERIVDPVARAFDPDFVLVSAGFDAHIRDPLGAMLLSDDGFRALARQVLRIARDCAQGRCAAVLEGGYDLQALQASVSAVLDEMGGASLDEAMPARTSSYVGLQRLLEIQRQHWKLS